MSRRHARPGQAPHRGGLGVVGLGVALALLALGLVAVGLAVGSTGFEGAWAAWDDPTALSIVREIRLPRTLGAWLAGALLGLSGAVAQGLFRNPLADPYLLGSATGASLGVAGMLAFGGLSPPHALAQDAWLERVGLTGGAFIGALLAVMLTLALARGVQHTLRLLLAGVVVGVVLGAVKDLLTLGAPAILQPLQSFVLGSTAFVNWPAVQLMALVLAICTAATLLLSRALDGLALGAATATSLGLPLGTMRAALVGVMALATGASVAHTGLIAFIGLAAPHLVRSTVRPTHGALALLSALMGGVLLLTADIAARWVIAPQELPVGVLSAVLGGGYLLWRMFRSTSRGLGG